MGDVKAVSGIKRAELRATVQHACGCIVDLGVVAASDQTWWQKLRQPKPKLVQICDGTACVSPYRDGGK